MTKINVILGAGQAGAWAATSMRREGFKGRIVLVGDEPIRPYERPPLSKEVLTSPESPEPTCFHDEQHYRDNDIELCLGVRAVQIEPRLGRIRLGNGANLPFDRLLLATGGTARRLTIPGGENVYYLRTMEDGWRLRERLSSAKRVVCIGAGVIGLEVASSARKLGCEVTVVEAGQIPMGRCVDMECSRFIEQLHSDADVNFMFGSSVKAIEADRVICEDRTEIPADCVVAGIGMERNLSLASEVGIEIDGGIVVDEYGRTNQSGIFAAGDVAAFWHPLFRRRLRLESWRHAHNHGVAVGAAMADRPKVYDDVPWFWTDQHGVNVQISGLATDGVRTIVRQGTGPKSFSTFSLNANGVVVAAAAVNNPREARAAQSLIRMQQPVDEAMLADSAVPLQTLIRPILSRNEARPVDIG